MSAETKWWIETVIKGLSPVLSGIVAILAVLVTQWYQRSKDLRLKHIERQEALVTSLRILILAFSESEDLLPLCIHNRDLFQENKDQFNRSIELLMKQKASIDSPSVSFLLAPIEKKEESLEAAHADLFREVREVCNTMTKQADIINTIPHEFCKDLNNAILPVVVRKIRREIILQARRSSNKGTSLAKIESMTNPVVDSCRQYCESIYQSLQAPQKKNIWNKLFSRRRS